MQGNIRDPEKAATTTATGHKVCGVELSSRYDQQNEYDVMMRVVRRLPPLLVRRLTSMWCDSKACATYTVEGELSQDDLDMIGIVFLETDGGHNGVYGPGDLYVDPDWNMTGIDVTGIAT